MTKAEDKEQHNESGQTLPAPAISLFTGLVVLIASTSSMPANSALKNTANNSTYRLVVIATLVARFVAGAAGEILRNLCNNLLAF